MSRTVFYSTVGARCIRRSALTYRLKEDFYAVYDAQTRSEAEEQYASWAARITPATSDAFRPLTTAWKNWHPEILNYFDHYRATNAYTESLNAHTGYLESQRTRLLFRGAAGEDALHRGPAQDRTAEIRAPCRQRLLSPHAIAARRRYRDDDAGRSFGEPTNYGTDISTLARRIAASRAILIVFLVGGWSIGRGIESTGAFLLSRPRVRVPLLGS
jgi:transposase